MNEFLTRCKYSAYFLVFGDKEDIKSFHIRRLKSKKSCGFLLILLSLFCDLSLNFIKYKMKKTYLNEQGILGINKDVQNVAATT